MMELAPRGLAERKAVQTPPDLPRDWPLARQSRVVQSGGTNWHCQEMGDGPSVLLLHGFGASCHTWADILPRIAPFASAISIDLPGHGWSDELPGATVLDVAEAVTSLLARLGIVPRVIAGHSIGAALAIAISRRLTENRPRIVGFAPSLEAIPRSLAAPLERAAWAIGRSGVAGAVSRSIRLPGQAELLLLSANSLLPRKNVDRYRALLSRKDHLEGAVRFIAGWRQDLLWEEKPVFTDPFLVGDGAFDPLIRRQDIKRRILDHRVRRIGLGHLAHEVSPAHAASLIREALEKDRLIAR